MASETGSAEISSVFERLLRNGDSFPLLFPFILEYTNGETQQNTDRESSRQRIIMIDPSRQSMIVIDGTVGFDSLFRGGEKQGRPPASKATVDAMPRVKVGDGSCDGDCAICLEEMKAGDVAAEMPCKHRFHEKCIEEWLGIRGTCPVCRYEMPVDEEEEGKKTEERRRRREIWVRFSFNGSRRRGGEGEEEAAATAEAGSDQNQGAQNPASGGDDVSSSRINPETED